MYHSRFTSSVRALEPSQITYLRTRFRAPGPHPTGPASGGWFPSQALLLFSLTYGAGARGSELAQMRLKDALLDEEGLPSSHVRFLPETTKHRIGRKVPMHPEVRHDLLNFMRDHPGQQWVAFASYRGEPLPRPMSEYALTSWFRRRFREAGIDKLTINSGRKFFSNHQRRT